MNPAGPLADSRYFTHEAMHTTFSLRLRGEDEQSARDMARECFEWIDILESRLSRFIENSEISRINQMQAGETLYLSEPCHQCLLLALDAHARTGGLFDITLGTRIEHRKSGVGGPPPPVIGSLISHPDVAAVTCIEPGRELDLGGIGKGFALDQLKQILTDWGAQDAMLAAGNSSLLAYGPGTWPVDLTASSKSLRLNLANQSLSASGTGMQGSHIVHPEEHELSLVTRADRVWVLAPTAVLAEIWSTAFMLMDPSGIPTFISGNPEITAVYMDMNGSPISLKA